VRRRLGARGLCRPAAQRRRVAPGRAARPRCGAGEPGAPGLAATPGRRCRPRAAAVPARQGGVDHGRARRGGRGQGGVGDCPVSALPQSGPAGLLRREPLTVADLGAVLAIENAAYEFPWTRGNFIDALAAGNHAQGLRDAAGTLCAYCVAMAGVQEMHLLNLTVAPPYQHRGLARLMLDALVAASGAAD